MGGTLAGPPCPFPDSYVSGDPYNFNGAKSALFSQLFLCLSRACLGKMIVLYGICSKRAFFAGSWPLFGADSGASKTLSEGNDILL
jgi:hypothetical protein